jgi:hypothetical protein
MKRQVLLSLAMVLSVAAPIVAQQRFFFFEQRNPFKRPVKIPRAVLQVMRDEIKDRRGCQINETTNVGRWFFGSRIYLGGTRRAFILRSHQDCLNGANNDWFWIVLQTSHGYRMVLFDGTISVFVRNSKSHGLRDVETNAATAAIAFRNVYKFDGEVYKLTDCFEAMPVEAKLKRVPCRTS